MHTCIKDATHVADTWFDAATWGCDVAYDILQHTATHCNTLHTATLCNTLQQFATYCTILQHTATQYTTLKRTLSVSDMRIDAAAWGCDVVRDTGGYNDEVACCNALQRTAMHVNLQQPTAIQCSAL